MTDPASEALESNTGATAPARPLIVRWRSAAIPLMFAAAALGHALQVRNGAGAPEAFISLGAALTLALWGVFGRAPALPRRWHTQAVTVAAAAILAWEAYDLWHKLPGIYLRLDHRIDLTTYRYLLILGLCLGATALGRRPWAGRAHMPLLVLVHLLIGVWILHASPSPHIDVFMFQQDSVSALLNGINPYSLRFPNIYGHTNFYGPGMVVDGQLQFGFPYPPLSLLLVVPARVLAGDYRYTQLIAIELTALLFARARGDQLGRIAAAIFLFTPRIFFVLEQGWTEPLVVMLVALCVYLSCKRPQWTPYVFGLLLAIKQYTFLCAPALLLLIPRPWRRAVLARTILAVVVPALVVTLPLVLWDFPAFWHSAMQLQFLQPLRHDALSFLVLAVNLWGWPPQALYAVLPLGLAATTSLLAFWRVERNPTGFAAAIAVTMIVWLVSTKQSFCNHYFIAFGALCCTVAVSQPRWAVQRIAFRENNKPQTLG